MSLEKTPNYEFGKGHNVFYPTKLSRFAEKKYSSSEIPSRSSKSWKGWKSACFRVPVCASYWMYTVWSLLCVCVVSWSYAPVCSSCSTVYSLLGFLPSSPLVLAPISQSPVITASPHLGDSSQEWASAGQDFYWYQVIWKEWSSVSSLDYFVWHVLPSPVHACATQVAQKELSAG